MRKILALAAIIAACGVPAGAADEAAKVRSQVEEAQKAKMQEAQKRNALEKDAALRKGAAVDVRKNDAQQFIDKKTKEWQYVIGPNAAGSVGAKRSAEVEAAAAAAKAKIAAEAKARAAQQQAAAAQSAQNIKDSALGLKSQVTPKGTYGLKKQGSSLYVRQYGK